MNVPSQFIFAFLLAHPNQHPVYMLFYQFLKGTFDRYIWVHFIIDNVVGTFLPSADPRTNHVFKFILASERLFTIW
jgi:hypothetical protein